jgi:hypothetical protein
MKKQQWYLYLVLLSVIILSLLFGNRFMYENAATMSSQKTEYIQELDQDLGDVKLVKDETAQIISVKKTRNEELGNTIKKEQPELDALKLISKEKMNAYQELNTKWSLGLYVKPIVQLQFAKDGSVINIAKSPENNLPTDKIVNFNVDINNNKTNIKMPFLNNPNIIDFSNDRNNYISFPVFTMDQFSISFYIATYNNVQDNTNYSVLSLTNKNKLNPGLQIDIQGFDIMVYNALPSNKPWSVVLRYKRSSVWSHITYTYNYNPSSKNTTVKLYENGNLVAIQNGSGPLMADKKSFERPDTCVLGISGDRNRALNAGIAYFNFFAWELSDKIINRIINSNPKPVNKLEPNTDWK